MSVTVVNMGGMDVLVRGGVVPSDPIPLLATESKVNIKIR